MKKECYNCWYFRQYFVKHGAQFFGLIVGHCTNQNLDLKLRKKMDIHDFCEYWESAEPKKEERRESICVALRRIEEQLNEMKQILQDDLRGLPPKNSEE